MSSADELFDESTHDTNDASASEPTRINLRFVDLGGFPIEQLAYRVDFPNGESPVTEGTTDGEGRATPIEGVRPGSSFVVHVQKESSQAYKAISAFEALAGDRLYTLISPKLKIVLETQPMEGAPGSADQIAVEPPLPEHEKPESKAEAQPAASKTESKPVGQSPTGNTALLTKQSSQKELTIKSDRDTQGKPVAIITRRHENPWTKSILPGFFLWSLVDFVSATYRRNLPRKSQTPATAATHVTKPLIERASVPAKTEQQASGRLSAKEQAALDNLIRVAEEQVTLKFPKVSSDKLKIAYVEQKNLNFEKKPSIKYTSSCLKYVKLAFFRAKYTSGVTGTPDAKDSGADWWTRPRISGPSVLVN